MLVTDLSNFCLNSFIFMIDGLEVAFSYLIIAGLTCCHVVITTRATLDGFIISNAKGSTASAEKYFVIKRILFAFKKEFAATDNRRKHYYVRKKNREPSVLIFIYPLARKSRDKT